jgi:hypothetical protein
LQQAVTQQSARDNAQLKHAAVGHMRKGSNSPDLVRSFFGHKTFCYATLVTTTRLDQKAPDHDH